MPLIIAVLIIIVAVVCIRDSNKENSKQAAIREKDRRKTNAKLEHRTLDNYMKHGYSFDESFTKTYKDMIDAGYQPCIPRSAYHNREGVESSSCGRNGGNDVERYDSFWVQQRRDEAERRWQQLHPGTHIIHATQEEIDAMTYDNFPDSEYQYLQDIKRRTARINAEPIGTFIIYPGLGTCEVLAHNWDITGTRGTYTLKVLQTGAIISHIKIGDKQITRQGQ